MPVKLVKSKSYKQEAMDALNKAESQLIVATGALWDMGLAADSFEAADQRNGVNRLRKRLQREGKL